MYIMQLWSCKISRFNYFKDNLPHSFLRELQHKESVRNMQLQWFLHKRELQYQCKVKIKIVLPPIVSIVNPSLICTNVTKCHFQFFMQYHKKCLHKNDLIFLNGDINQGACLSDCCYKRFFRMTFDFAELEAKSVYV